MQINRQKLWRCGIISLFLWTLISCAQSNDFSLVSADKRFEQKATDIWQEYVHSSPFLSTYAGEKHNADKMPDLSERGIELQQQRLEQWLKVLKQTPLEQLSEQNKINYQTLLHRLENDLDEILYRSHYMPLTSEGGFHSSLAFLVAATQINDEQDVQNYLSRLAAFEVYFQQNIAWMRKGIAIGMTQPKAVLEGYETSISRLKAEQAELSVFYQPIKDLPFLTTETANQYQKQAIAVIEGKVNQALDNYYRFMVNEYIPAAKSDIAISSIPDGLAFYKNRAKHYTTTDLSPEEIHAIGLTEVARIRQEMEEIINQVGFEGSFSEFLHFLRNDPRFYAKTGEELLKEASYIAKRMDAQLPKLFNVLPRTPYGVAPVPDHIAPKYTTGRYIPASKSTDAGYYWVNTYGLDRRPLYELEALTLHEAVPGHHLQISLTKELKDTPDYRSSYYISAFGEGWGLYSEWLGLEVGFYQDPYSNFGRLTYEMWRALRLVVDTGMHTKGWTRQQAINFMSENSALSSHNITTEVDRYISWPAQALSYKIGEITIKKLRSEAERELGEAFDVREFHNQVLKNGSVTLSQLERQIQTYINQTKISKTQGI